MRVRRIKDLWVLVMFNDLRDLQRILQRHKNLFNLWFCSLIIRSCFDSAMLLVKVFEGNDILDKIRASKNGETVIIDVEILPTNYAGENVLSFDRWRIMCKDDDSLDVLYCSFSYNWPDNNNNEIQELVSDGN